MKKRDRKSSRRELYGKSTRERVKRTYDQSEPSGGGIFKENLTDVTFWKCKEGDHLIDIIPYFAGPNDPDPEVAEGTDTYKLEVFAHGGLGPNDQMVVCLAKTFNKKCPICEDRKRLLNEASPDEELINSLKVSRFPRVIYNIVCYDSSEEENKGVQVWHTSSYLMERYLVELARNPRVRSGGIEAFTDFSHIDSDKGKSISFTRKGTGTNTQFIGHKFVDRDYDIPDEALEKAHTLDQLIHIPTYDEVYKLYHGEDDEETEEKPEKSSVSLRERKKEKRVPDKELDEEDDDSEEEEEEEEYPEDEDEDEDEDKPSPKPPKRKLEVKKKKKDEVEDDEEEEEEEEEEKPSRRASLRNKDKKEKKVEKKGKSACPQGGTFGKDIDELDECEECEVWTDCAKEADRLEEEGE